MNYNLSRLPELMTIDVKVVSSHLRGQSLIIVVRSLLCVGGGIYKK